jgi:hypothetical protein
VEASKTTSRAGGLMIFWVAMFAIGLGMLGFGFYTFERLDIY